MAAHIAAMAPNTSIGAASAINADGSDIQGPLGAKIETHAVALIRAQSALKSLKLEDDEQIGVDIVRRAIEEPIRMIVQNAGGEGSIVIEKVRMSKDKNFGYNAYSDVYEDLVLAGVIDPVKVTRTALQNAASIASMLLTTECLIVEKKEKDSTPPMPQGGMF